jgi:hypothetical protein
VLSAARFPLWPTFFPETKGAVTGIVGAAGGIGGFFPPLVLSVVRDATGEYVMGFVLLVAFAWLCAGQALAVRKPRPRPASARWVGNGRWRSGVSSCAREHRHDQRRARPRVVGAPARACPGLRAGWLAYIGVLSIDREER